MKGENKNAFIAAFAVVLAAIIGTFGILFTQEDKIAEGSIESPKNNSNVERKITANGTLKNIPADNHVWLAIKINDDVWPKKEIISRGQSWVETIEEHGDTEKFSLILIMVDEASNKIIKKWNQAMSESKRWFPIAKNVEFTVLDSSFLNIEPKKHLTN